MSRDLGRRILIFCIVVVVVAGIRLVPEWWAKRAQKDVASDAANNAVQNMIQQSAESAARDAARKMADEMARNATKDNGGSTTRAAATNPAPVIDTAAYRITLPDHSTINPQDSTADQGSRTTSNLPGGGTMIFVAIDKKDQVSASFDQAVASLRATLENPAVRTTDTFDAARAVRSTALGGNLKGMPFEFEVGQIEGQSRGCVIILEYPEARRGETVALARKALESFRMKD